MKKLVMILAIAAVMVMVVGAVVYADGHSSREVRERLDSMQARIDRGISSGELTGREAERLQGELRRIRHEFQQMKWDGLSPRERRKLESDMDRLDRDISRKNHNYRRAY
jgi:septal ring factor EnvC (AmiA/AmiB activator)